MITLTVTTQSAETKFLQVFTLTINFPRSTRDVIVMDCRKWAQRMEFKSLTKLFVIHLMLMPLRQVWISLPLLSWEIVGKTRLFNLGKTTSLEKRKSLSVKSIYLSISVHHPIGRANNTPTVSPCKEVRPYQNGVSCVWHLTASGGETPVLELWEEWSTLSILLLPFVVHIKVTSVGQIHQFEDY